MNRLKQLQNPNDEINKGDKMNADGNNTEYFMVFLKNGMRLELNERCNELIYTDPNFCVFIHRNEDKSFETLALIPYSSIHYIKKIPKNSNGTYSSSDFESYKMEFIQ